MDPTWLENRAEVCKQSSNWQLGGREVSDSSLESVRQPTAPTVQTTSHRGTTGQTSSSDERRCGKLRAFRLSCFSPTTARCPPITWSPTMMRCMGARAPPPCLPCATGIQTGWRGRQRSLTTQAWHLQLTLAWWSLDRSVWTSSSPPFLR